MCVYLSVSVTTLAATLLISKQLTRYCTLFYGVFNSDFAKKLCSADMAVLVYVNNLAAPAVFDTPRNVIVYEALAIFNPRCMLEGYSSPSVCLCYRAS